MNLVFCSGLGDVLALCKLARVEQKAILQRKNAIYYEQPILTDGYSLKGMCYGDFACVVPKLYSNYD